MRFIPSQFDPLASPCSLIPLVEARAKTHQSVTIYHTAQVGHKKVNPFTILVWCDTLVILAVAQVNRLHFASHSNLDELAAHLLADPTTKVDCQLLHLVPATIEDDPTHIHDWCWSMHMEATCENVDGRYIHLLNPAISVLRPGKPTFLFEGSFLVTLSCSMFQDLWPQDYQSLPVVRQIEFFPYRFEGMLVPVLSLDS